MSEQKMMYNTILVHTARTWERIRLEQPHKEIENQDNISSVDTIIEVADTIFKNDIIQKFFKRTILEQNIGYWELNTESGYSDSFIEELATEEINKRITHN
jgi:hypothetical protein